MDLAHVAQSLQRRGFGATVFQTADEAKAYLLSALAQVPSVGFGGCMTIKNMGLADALRAAGTTVHWHWEAAPGTRADTLEKAMHADAYVCSANALLRDGRVVEIDGSGNRVAALCFGPAKAYLVVGRNKLVTGGLLAAITRVKREACPPNARRLALNTPCAQHGTCDEERCKYTMCRVTLVIDAPPTGHTVEVLLVDEDLGY